MPVADPRRRTLFTPEAADPWVVEKHMFEAVVEGSTALTEYRLGLRSAGRFQARASDAASIAVWVLTWTFARR